MTKVLLLSMYYQLIRVTDTVTTSLECDNLTMFADLKTLVQIRYLCGNFTKDKD